MLALASQAQQEPRLGQEYTVLDKQQPVEAGKKVEVLEFFGYFCPGCNAFEPYFEEWIKKQGDRIVVKRVHSTLHEVTTQQKLYYTLEAMGKVDEYQLKAFNAYHIDRNRMSTDAEVLKFVEKNGIDKKAFLEVYNSFTVQSKVNRIKQLEAAYKINGVPTIFIDGRFMVSPLEVANKNQSGDTSPRAGTVVMSWLVDKVYKEKNGATPAPAPAPVATTSPPKKK
jgi:thiol:disulfide interchange protein DsbA